MSTIYYPGCDEVIPDPICSDCPDKELGGIRSIWLQKVNFAFADITDPAEWQQAICDKNVYVFPYTRGTLTPAPQESPGFGNVANDVDAYEFTLNIFEPNYASNCDFWNAMKKSHNYLVGWRTETKIHLSSVAALIEPMAPVSEDLKSKVLWNVIMKFIQEDNPCPVNMPLNTFERCIACV